MQALYQTELQPQITKNITIQIIPEKFGSQCRFLNVLLEKRPTPCSLKLLLSQIKK